MIKFTAQDQTEAVAELRGMLPPGTTVYTVLRHVAPSGMTRWISCLAIVDGKLINLDWYVERAGIGSRDRRHEGIKVGGCGMDMGFHLVYSLSRVIHRDAFHCTGQHGCPANDHVNDRGEPDYSPERLHSDAGYALIQKWI